MEKLLVSPLRMILILASLTFGQAIAQPQVAAIEVRGNAKVEIDALLNLMISKTNAPFSQENIAKDIQEIFKLGYFSDVRVYKENNGSDLHLIFEVIEKPAITNIEFLGMKELKQEDLKDQLSTKLYTIVDEGKIAADVRLIEKKYTEKGFFLAKVTTSIKQTDKNEISLTYHVDEKGKVLVGDVKIIGNHAFSSGVLLEQFAQKPFTRFNALFGQSAFQEDLVSRDTEFLTFYYKDQGYAKAQVAKPIVVIDQDKHFVRITMRVEEGKPYRIAKLRVTGDVGPGLYSEDELLEKMKLKPETLFRYSHFQKDVEMLVNQYGDLGFAYADINPITEFDDEKGVVSLNYEITKGEKVFFGRMFIVGNTKTRDHVVRREFEVADSELYAGTLLTKSKNNVSRLGFFEEVQVIKERDLDQENVLNLKVKVKEKPTGQLQAALGFSPGGETKQSWSGQGRYDEKNQSGNGWNTNLTGKWSNSKDYTLELGFYDPKVNDSEWSYGINASYLMQETRYDLDIEVPEVRTSIGYTIGRKVIELIRASLTLKHSYTEQQEPVYLFDGYFAGGVKNTLILGLTSNELDNYIDPTQGSAMSLTHQFNGGVLGGDSLFMETNLDLNWYLPFDFSDTYRTYLKTHGFFGILWPVDNKPIPRSERYRLGGYNNLRGFKHSRVGPYEKRGRSPMDSYYYSNVGGDREVYLQFEYFMPLIPQAGIKGLVFADTGRIYAEEDPLSLREFKSDIGFGFRWITPIAPFRFEWAYPYDNEKNQLGDMEIIFTLGF